MLSPCPQPGCGEERPAPPLTKDTRGLWLGGICLCLVLNSLWIPKKPPVETWLSSGAQEKPQSPCGALHIALLPTAAASWQRPGSASLSPCLMLPGLRMSADVLPPPRAHLAGDGVLAPPWAIEALNQCYVGLSPLRSLLALTELEGTPHLCNHSSPVRPLPKQ